MEQPNRVEQSYVNFNKKEISADVFSKVTLKVYQLLTTVIPQPLQTTIPVVVSVAMALGSDGSTSLDTLIDMAG